MRIAVFLPESPWGDIDDQAMDKGLGGRETALVQLAVAWAKAGHEIYAFVPREDVRHLGLAEFLVAPLASSEAGVGYVNGFVKWIPMERVLSIAPVLDLDLFVSWENIEVFKQLGFADVGKRVIHMQVAHLNIEDPDDLRFVDQIACLSPWAVDFMKTQVPEEWADEPRRWVVFPNGVDTRRFQFREVVDDPDHVHFIYSSSPDRGLHHLLMMWEAIRLQMKLELGKEPVLHVCYGAERFVESSRWSHRGDAERALVIENVLGKDDPSIVYHGKVGQDELADIMLMCRALLYPCDAMSPTETGCITIVEALAAGIQVVTTRCDCLGGEFKPYTWMVDLPLDYSEYIDMIMRMLKQPDTEKYRTLAQRTQDFVATRDWSWIASQWIDYYNKVAA